MDIGTCSIPALQSLAGERVPEVGRSWSDPTGVGLHAGAAEQRAERTVRSADREACLVTSDEQAIVGASPCIHVSLSLEEVALDFARERPMKWDTTCSALALSNEEDPVIEIDVAESKSERFAEPEAGAVEDEQERPIQAGSKCGPIERRREAQ
jgi:hypothetical protein